MMGIINRDRINEIRQENGIPVRELSNIGVSRNRYYRYLNGENDLPTENFLLLIDHLLLTTDEVIHELVVDSYTVEELVQELEQAYKQRDIDAIKRVSRQGYQSFRETMARGFLRVASLADVLSARLIPEQHMQVAQKILLESFETITHWHQLDVDLIEPVFDLVSPNKAYHYLVMLWQQTWPTRTVQKINRMTVQYMITLMNMNYECSDQIRQLAGYLIEQHSGDMLLSWWRKLTDDLQRKQWTDALDLLNLARKLGLKDIAKSGECYMNTWYNYTLRRNK